MFGNQEPVFIPYWGETQAYNVGIVVAMQASASSMGLCRYRLGRSRFER
ncbi:MAG: hypothetical protein GY938_08830 [Ketobacter sp.]|nr:hypothetical protein [Ketobacter sp.]